MKGGTIQLSAMRGKRIDPPVRNSSTNERERLRRAYGKAVKFYWHCARMICFCSQCLKARNGKRQPLALSSTGVLG